MPRQRNGDNLGEALKKMQDGDPEATEKVVRIATSPLSQLAWVLLVTFGHSPDKDAIDEIVQRTFVRLYEKIDRFDVHNTTPPIKWIKAFLRNIFREYERENRRIPVASADKQRKAQGRADCSNSPQRIALKEACCTKIRAAVKRLSKEHPDLHATFFDFYYREWLRPQIAERRKLPLGTVKSRLHRAEDLIRKYLQELGGVGNPFDK